MGALRCLKRRLSDRVYRHLLNDAVARAAAGPEGHAGATTRSCASDPTPMVSPSDKSLTGPASSDGTTARQTRVKRAS
jgi:transposase